MKRLAIITPGCFPVPAVKGGAVEQLIDVFVKCNEIDNIYNIDLLTVGDEKLKDIKLKNTSIITIKPTIFEKLYCLIYNYFFHFIGKGYKYYYPFSLASTKNFDINKYDYVLVENTMSIVKRLPKSNKLFFHLHNDIIKDGQPEYQCKIVAEKCNKIIAISEYIKQRFCLITDENKIKVLPNCIDFDEYDIKRFNDDLVIKQRNRWNVDKNDFVFVFTGRLSKEKGVIELIEAFNKLNKEYNDIRLILIGDNKRIVGIDNETLDKVCENNKNIVFTGYIDQKDIPLSLYSSDVVVVPSKWQEPFGLVSLEPMAMRKPIIATKVGGMVEQLDDDCAVMVDIDNLTDNLYKAMKYLYENKDIREIKANRAYEKVKSNDKYDSKSYLKKLCEILEKS